MEHVLLFCVTVGTAMCWMLLYLMKEMRGLATGGNDDADDCVFVTSQPLLFMSNR